MIDPLDSMDHDLFGDESAWTEADEAQFDKECDEAWELIEKMTPEEINQYLYSHGYTKESLAASFERFKELLRKYGGNPK